MNCIDVNEKLADLFDDSVSQDKKEELFAHIRECAVCKKVYDDTLGIVAELKPRVTVAAGRDLHSKILDQALNAGKP